MESKANPDPLTLDKPADPDLVPGIANIIRAEYLCRHLHRYAILMQCDLAHAIKTYSLMSKTPRLQTYVHNTLLPLLRKYKKLSEIGIRLTEDMELGKDIPYEIVMPFAETFQRRGGNIMLGATIDKIRALRISSDRSETNQSLFRIIGDQLRHVKELCKRKIIEFDIRAVRTTNDEDGSDTETEEVLIE